MPATARAGGPPASQIQLAKGRARAQEPGLERMRAEALEPDSPKAALRDQVDRLWRKPRPHAVPLAEPAKKGSSRQSSHLESDALMAPVSWLRCSHWSTNCLSGTSRCI